MVTAVEKIFSGASDPKLPDNVKDRPLSLRRRWVAIWNSVFEDTGNEGRAFASANAILKSRKAFLDVASEIIRNRINKVGAGPQSYSKCMDCSASPTVEFLWAEGMGRAWFCAKHYHKWAHTKDNVNGKANAGDIVSERQVRWGVVARRWRDGPMNRSDSEAWLATHKGGPEISKAALVGTPRTWAGESERIRENRKGERARKEHRWRPAKFTHPNGHPRCALCGHSQYIGEPCKGVDNEDKAPPGFGPHAKAALSTGDFGGPGQAPLSISQVGVPEKYDWQRKPAWFEKDDGEEPELFLGSHIPFPISPMGLDAPHLLEGLPWSEEAINFRDDPREYSTGKVCGSCRFFLRDPEGSQIGGCRILAPEVKVAYFQTSDAYINATEEAIVTLQHKRELEKQAGEIQSFILDKERFKTKEDARKWARDNDAKFGNIEETENSWRLRQFPPGDCKTGFRTITVTEGVKGALCLPSRARVDADKAANQEGVMAAIFLPSKVGVDLALPDGEDRSELHITLGYFGDSKDMDDGTFKTIIETIREVTEETTPFKVTVSGVGKFAPSDSSNGDVPFFAKVDSPGLMTFRRKLVKALDAAGAPVDKTHPDYMPHITLKYLKEGEDAPTDDVGPMSFDVDTIHLAIASRSQSFKFGTSSKAAEDDDSAVHQIGIWKAEEERRFTFGVVYKASADSGRNPETDAHNEFVTATDLQLATWGHVQAGDRRIYIQHGQVAGLGFKTAGQWVEICAWPHEQEVELRLPTGERRKSTIPAGSVYMGVIWEPFAWELVKAGKIRGFSFGGLAGRVNA